MNKLKSILLVLFVSLFFMIPVHASSAEYVKDEYGLLSSSEKTTLEAAAKKVSEEYQVGVYVRVMNSYSGYSSIEKYAEAVYKDEQLGITNGTSRECVMLILTMDDRSYDILAHGNTANAAFTDYGKQELASDVVSYLKQKDYYSGFKTFISECSDYLKAEASGSPVDVPGYDPAAEAAQHQAMIQNIRYGVTFAGAPLIALIVCLIIKAKNKTAGIKLEASGYVPKDGIHLTGMQDIFLYRTEQVVHINRDHGGHGGGGTSINSGGFSHSSGHF